MSDKKADITLPDSGRAVIYDLHKLTFSEWQDLFEPGHPFEDEQATMERVTGITIAEQKALSMYDFKLLWREFYRVMKQPLSDPN